MINHRRIYRNENLIQTKIPLVDEITAFFKNGDFPLITDPLKTGRTAVIGMFILRPALETWNEEPVLENGKLTIYDVRQWVYSVDGLSGGGVLADGNIMDAYRLAMQYAITDAVIVGSSTVIRDGVPSKKGNPGYMWLPQYCAEWPHLKKAVPEMMKHFRLQRRLMQKMGYASQRDYPAQIAVTRSGKRTEPDLLSASIFHECLPDGSPVEAYIVTSSTGASRLRNRAAEYNLESRIDDLLIVISPRNKPEEIDLGKLPGILFTDYNIILANHDGGKKVLDAFCRAGITDQLNFTFARRPSLYDVIKNNSSIENRQKKLILSEFASRIKYFFDTDNGEMPGSLSVAEMITDESEEAVVAVINTRDTNIF